MKLKEPAYVPFGWLVAILGASGTAIMSAFTIGIWSATMSKDQEAMARDIVKLQTEQAEVSALANRLIRVETILTYVYPEQAREARKRTPAEQ